MLLLTLAFFVGLYQDWRQDGSDSTEIAVGKDVIVGNNVVVRRTSGGMFAQDWEGVRIIERSRHFPLLEKTLYSVNIGETELCNGATVRAVPDSIAHQVTVQCGDTKPYVWARVKIP
jgi:hypothetical protein